MGKSQGAVYGFDSKHPPSKTFSTRKEAWSQADELLFDLALYAYGDLMAGVYHKLTLKGGGGEFEAPEALCKLLRETDALDATSRANVFTDSEERAPAKELRGQGGADQGGKIRTGSAAAFKLCQLLGISARRALSEGEVELGSYAYELSKKGVSSLNVREGTSDTDDLFYGGDILRSFRDAGQDKWCIEKPSDRAKAMARCLADFADKQTEPWVLKALSSAITGRNVGALQLALLAFFPGDFTAGVPGVGVKISRSVLAAAVVDTIRNRGQESADKPLLEADVEDIVHRILARLSAWDKELDALIERKGKATKTVRFAPDAKKGEEAGGGQGKKGEEEGAQGEADPDDVLGIDASLCAALAEEEATEAGGEGASLRPLHTAYLEAIKILLRAYADPLVLSFDGSGAVLMCSRSAPSEEEKSGRVGSFIGPRVDIACSEPRVVVRSIQGTAYEAARGIFEDDDALTRAFAPRSPAEAALPSKLRPSPESKAGQLLRVYKLRGGRMRIEDDRAGATNPLTFLSQEDLKTIRAFTAANVKRQLRVDKPVPLHVQANTAHALKGIQDAEAHGQQRLDLDNVYPFVIPVPGGVLVTGEHGYNVFTLVTDALDGTASTSNHATGQDSIAKRVADAKDASELSSALTRGFEIVNNKDPNKRRRPNRVATHKGSLIPDVFLFISDEALDERVTCPKVRQLYKLSYLADLLAKRAVEPRSFGREFLFLLKRTSTGLEERDGLISIPEVAENYLHPLRYLQNALCLALPLTNEEQEEIKTRMDTRELLASKGTAGKKWRRAQAALLGLGFQVPGSEIKVADEETMRAIKIEYGKERKPPKGPEEARGFGRGLPKPIEGPARGSGGTLTVAGASGGGGARTSGNKTKLRPGEEEAGPSTSVPASKKPVILPTVPPKI